MTVGLLELSILLFVVFVALGPKRITNLFRALGRGVRDFTEEFGRERRDRELPEREPDGDSGREP
jgi:sec-independent protein translocase protein TatA